MKHFTFVVYRIGNSSVTTSKGLMKVFKDKRFEWLALIWVFIVIVIYLQYVFEDFFSPKATPAWMLLVFSLSSLISGVILIFLSIPLFDLTEKLNKYVRFGLLALLGMPLTVIYVIAVNLISVYFSENALDNYWNAIGKSLSKDFHNFYRNHIFFMAVLYAIEYFERQKNVINEKKDLEIELNTTKLQVLKSQIQPHFLFNSLNSIVAVIDENKKKAQGMVVKLSDILRTALNADFDKLWTLEEELLFIEDYLKVEKIRYEDQLQYDINVTERGKSLMVPTLILQPVVENAIRHGYKGIKKSLKIIVDVNANEKKIQVVNDGAPLRTDLKLGTGLTNVVRRLEIFYGKKENFKIYMQEGLIINEILLK